MIARAPQDREASTTLRRLADFLRRRGAERYLLARAERFGDFLYEERHGRSRYEAWFQARLAASLAEAGAHDLQGPLISVLMPVCDPEPRFLAAAIRSVSKQVYSNWELRVVDDASTRPEVADLLAQAARQDARVHVVRNRERQGIANSSNRAMDAALGSYVALLDHDDALTPDALLATARAAVAGAFDILYSDEDKIDVSGRLCEPTFKPERSRELLYACMYFGHLTVYRRAFADSLGGFDPAYDGSQDYELALRAEHRADRVVHLPSVLYHWRMAPGSAASGSGDAKPWAHSAGRRAIASTIADREPGARVVDGIAPGFSRVVRSSNESTRVSVLYCSCCGSPEQLLRAARAPSPCGEPLEIEWIEIAESIDARRPPVSERWNRAAKQASGEVFVFLDGVRPSQRGGEPAGPREALEEWVSQAVREDIGAVGVRIVSARDALLHAGVAVGGSECVRAEPWRLRGDDPGPMGWIRVVREVSAIAGGALAMRRDLLERSGGFDAAFEDALHDVDLCLRLRSRGLRVLYDGHVECVRVGRHFSGGIFGATGTRRPAREDEVRLRAGWPDLAGAEDPFHSPNFHETGPLFRPRFR